MINALGVEGDTCCSAWSDDDMIIRCCFSSRLMHGSRAPRVRVLGFALEKIGPLRVKPQTPP